MKTSLAPGSTVVTDYLDQAGLTEYLDKLGFNLVGYGCTTCIGNSGPLPEEISEVGERQRPRGLLGALGQPQLRGPDQPGRPQQLPRLAAALRRLRPGRADGRRHPRRSRWARAPTASPSTCATSGPPSEEIKQTVGDAVRSDMFTQELRGRLHGRRALAPARDPGGRPLRVDRLDLRPTAAVLRGHGPRAAADPEPIEGARVLAVLGDSVTTDHISPAGAIKKDSPAGQWLIDHGVERARLQLLRLAPRQPRGDDPRDLRQHPAAKPAGRPRGRLHAPLPRWRGDHDLRGRDAVRGRGRAAGRPGRQGVRLGLVARLGGQGDGPARRAGGARARATSASTAPT